MVYEFYCKTCKKVKIFTSINPREKNIRCCGKPCTSRPSESLNHFLAWRAPDACPACLGKSYFRSGNEKLKCVVCAGTGKRR